MGMLKGKITERLTPPKGNQEWLLGGDHNARGAFQGGNKKKQCQQALWSPESMQSMTYVRPWGRFFILSL